MEYKIINLFMFKGPRIQTLKENIFLTFQYI